MNIKTPEVLAAELVQIKKISAILDELEPDALWSIDPYLVPDSQETFEESCTCSKGSPDPVGCSPHQMAVPPSEWTISWADVQAKL